MPTMTTTTPTPGNTPTLEDALREILTEVTPGQRPFSSDSYLPVHLIDLARLALAQLPTVELAPSQHAFNALSVASWHCARGEMPQALARMRLVARLGGCQLVASQHAMEVNHG